MHEGVFIVKISCTALVGCSALAAILQGICIVSVAALSWTDQDAVSDLEFAIELSLPLT